jgi:hypothetical protein
MRHRPWGRRSLSQSRFKATMKLLGGSTPTRAKRRAREIPLGGAPVFRSVFIARAGRGPV